MSNVLDIVKQMNQACDAKDFDTVRRLLHPQYTLRGPLMKVDSGEEMLAGMQACPFTCTAENFTYVTEGNKVAQIFDWVNTAPVPFTLRMCSIVTVEDGKVRSEEMFFDSAKLPKEIADLMQQPAAELKKAA